MATENTKNGTFSAHLWQAGKFGGAVIEDLARAVIGFVPNGLNVIYDSMLKSLPLLGQIFAHRWIEQSLKLCLGITIGQGLASDVAHYVFKPIGYLFGFIVGLLSKQIPNYQDQIGKALYRISGLTIGGILFGLGLVTIGIQTGMLLGPMSLKYVVFAIGLGAFFGVAAKLIALFSIQWVESANAAAVRRNVNRARELNVKLKSAARQYAKSKILMYAQDIIVQMNGAKAGANLDEFFKSEYEHFANNTHQKMDRHFDYLADRACHGDIQALRKLQSLIPNKKTPEGKSDFEGMIDRILNERAIFKLKDDVDTFFDRYQYRALA